MKRILTLFIFSLLTITSSWGQKGYQGGNHSVYFDLFNLAYQNQAEVQYRYTFTKNMAAVAGLQTTFQESPSSLRPEGHSNAFNQNLDQQTRAYTGVELGLMLNRVQSGQPMPIGYYAGLLFGFTSGSQSDTYLDPASSRPTIYEFNHNYSSLRLVYGKNLPLFNKLLLDMSIETGFRFGAIESNAAIAPAQLYPIINPLGADISWPNVSGGTTETVSYSHWWLMPKIRLGFAF